jgi:hypothetical protein
MRDGETALNRTLSSALVSGALAVFALVVAPRASAQEESMAQATTTDTDMGDVQARGHFRLGREYYEQGRFADAAQEFEIAYGLSGRGQLLYNVYLAYRDAQDTPNAARALRGYLTAVPDAPDHDHLQARLTALEATVTADQEAEAARVAAEAEQHRQLEEAERRAMEAEARASSGPPAASRPWWPWLVFGGGLALAVAGGVLDGVAGSDADALRRSCVSQSATMGFTQPLTMGSMCAPSVNLDSRRSAIMGEALAGDVLWIAGAVVAITGLVLAFVLPDDQPSDSATPTVSAGCGPTGCTGNVSVSF